MAQPLPHTPTSPFPSPCTFSNGVAALSSEGQDDSVYDQFWHQTDFQNKGSDWVSDWDTAFTCSSEKEIEVEEGDMGAGVEGDDLLSSIRDYFTQKEGEWKEEAGEKHSSGHIIESVNLPVPVQTGTARTQIQCVGLTGEARQVTDDSQVSKSVRHISVDSAEDNEGEQRSIYECLELQCQWPSPSARGSLERHTGEKRVGGNTGVAACQEEKCDVWTEIDDKWYDKEKTSIKQDTNTVESIPESNQTLQTLDTNKSRIFLSSAKKNHPGGVHVSFRPSTESVLFHNPLESKEAHWKARLRRLSHFHTHSHSAGERHGVGAGAGSGAKMGAGSMGKFSSVAGISYKSGAHEKSAIGSVTDVNAVMNTAAPGSVENRAGAVGDKDKQHLGSCGEGSLGPEAHPEVSSSSSTISSVPVPGVRGRLGRSALRSRASRSRSQEPRGSASRHHQGALLGGVYKTVVHALSSKPRPRGQGSSQGSSPQRHGRATMADASLRDLYSHVLGYFGRKTTTAGEDWNKGGAHKGHNRYKNNLGEAKTHQQSITNGCLFLFWLFLTGLL